MSDLVKVLCVAAIVAVILLLLCPRSASESLQTGYPWIRCPAGYTYDLEGTECVPSVPATMVGSGGRVLKF